MSLSKGPSKVSSVFATHCSGQRTDTGNHVLESIQRNYSDPYVAEVHQSNVSLIDFANYGNATYELDPDVEPYVTKHWCAAENRLEDELRFACWKYTWENYSYTVFSVIWKEPFQPQNRMYYVVSYKPQRNEVDRLLKVVGKWSSQLHNEIFVFDEGRWMKSEKRFESIKNACWDDVVLEPNMKEKIESDVLGFFKDREAYEDIDVPWKRGIIFHGDPGNGKTETIKALTKAAMELSIEGQAAVSVLYVKSFASHMPGGAEEKSIHEVFQKARESSPCIVIFEDLDTLVKEDQRSYFLNEVDGFELNHGILMIASANDLEKLDPAIAKRPSRFDSKYHFKAPDQKGRVAFASQWEQRLEKSQKIKFPKSVFTAAGAQTEGFSFASLKELFVATLSTFLRESQHKNEEESRGRLVEILEGYIELQRSQMKV